MTSGPIKRFSLSDRQAEVWHMLSDPDNQVEEVFYGGAAGGGKSTLIAAFKIARRIMYPGTVGLIARHQGVTLADTTMKTFVRFWEEYGQYNPYGVRMRISGRNDAVFSNGSLEMFRHTAATSEDREGTRFGSLELTDLAIDELAECSERIVDIIASRVRYKLIHGKRAIIYTGNPTDNWVMGRYIQDRDGKPATLQAHQAVVRALLEDNPDQEFVKQYSKSLATLNDYDRNRLLLGMWGETMENKVPYFAGYEKSKHYNPCKPDDGYPLYISFDFNFDPTTALIGQKIPGQGVNVYKELQVKGGTAMLCDKIIDSGIMEHPNFILVTGDSSGSRANSTAGMEPTGKHRSDFEIIKSMLKIPARNMLLRKKQNERLAYSAKVVNHLFTTVPVNIDPECIALHRDLRTAKRLPDGTLLKNRLGHPQDAGDAFRYMVHVMFPAGIKDIDRFKLDVAEIQKEPNADEVIRPKPVPKPVERTGKSLDANFFD